MTATEVETVTIEHLDFTACCQMKWALFEDLNGLPVQISKAEVCKNPAAFYGTVHTAIGCTSVVKLMCQDCLRFANELCPHCGAPYLSNIQPLSGKW